jgi:hypothetical protein
VNSDEKARSEIFPFVLSTDFCGVHLSAAVMLENRLQGTRRKKSSGKREAKIIVVTLLGEAPRSCNSHVALMLVSI